MAERNVHFKGFSGRKSLFSMLSITSILFMLSLLFVLRTTGRHHFFYLNVLPQFKILALSDEGYSQSSSQPLKKYNLFKCNPSKQVLKVYMYDLPPQFHFELLGWKAEGKSVWPDIRKTVPGYPGGLNLQHSIEYWLTLDLLFSEFTDNSNGRSAIRVHNSSEADVVFVPFFSSVCYNRFSKLKPNPKKSTGVLLQEKLVEFLTVQEEWKRSGGKDHIILAHHPNNLLDARMKLWPAVFILSDFGRYPPTVANVEKDVIAPYKHVISNYGNDTSDFDSQPTLLYFQGAIYRKDMYKGQMKDGSYIAIRCLKTKRNNNSQNFMHHIEMMSKLRHHHLVSTLGHCFECYLDDSSVSRIFLVFEYVPNGTLRSWISDKHSKRRLTWTQRIAAAIGIARGIQFLHTGIVPGIFSNNIKITDILLDQNLVAKICSYNLPILSENVKENFQNLSEGSKELKNAR